MLLKSRIALGDSDFSSSRAFYPQPACMVGVLSFSAKAGNFAGSRKVERAHIGAAATAAIAVRGSKEPIPSSIRELLRESQS